MTRKGYFFLFSCLFDEIIKLSCFFNEIVASITKWVQLNDGGKEALA